MKVAIICKAELVVRSNALMGRVGQNLRRILK